jgi:hypothetical protein
LCIISSESSRGRVPPCGAGRHAPVVHISHIRNVVVRVYFSHSHYMNVRLRRSSIARGAQVPPRGSHGCSLLARDSSVTTHWGQLYIYSLRVLFTFLFSQFHRRRDRTAAAVCDRCDTAAARTRTCHTFRTAHPSLRSSDRRRRAESVFISPHTTHKQATHKRCAHHIILSTLLESGHPTRCAPI